MQPSFLYHVSAALETKAAWMWASYLRTRIIYNTSPLLGQVHLLTRFPSSSHVLLAPHMLYMRTLIMYHTLALLGLASC